MATMLMAPSRETLRISADSAIDTETVSSVQPPKKPQYDPIDKDIPSLPAAWESRIPLGKGKQPVNEHRSSQKPSPGAAHAKDGQNDTSSQMPSMSVTVKQRKREQLKTLRFTSTLKLIADENATFHEQHENKLQEFMKSWDIHNAIWFHGLPPRNLCITLVAIANSIPSIRPSSTGEKPYICIKGLRSEAEIIAFHAILSQRSIREKYKPLKLCYDRALVRTSAADEVYQGDISLAEWTLCGLLMQVNDGKGRQWMSTVGGVIEIDGKLYALTTAHSPENGDSGSQGERQNGDSKTLYSLNSVDTLVDEKSFDDDVEPALVVDNWIKLEDCPSLPSLMLNVSSGTKDEPSPAHFWPGIGQSVMKGSDWSLIRIDDSILRPNAIVGLATGATDKSGQVPQLGSEYGPNRTYLTKYDTSPVYKAVHIITGRTGICRGVLLGNKAYLCLASGPSTVVWTVKLESGTNLQAGDSGSWVVDAANNSALGHIVAFTYGVAYLMPLCHVFRDIKAVMKPNGAAQLPSSFSVLANLAHRFQLQADISLSNKYALEALSMAVLESDTSNPIAKLLQRALKTSQDRTPFMVLIRWAGSNIRQALLSPEAWLSAQNDIPQRQQIEEVLTLLLGLQDLEISPDPQNNPTSAIRPSLMEPIDRVNPFQAPLPLDPRGRETQDHTPDLVDSHFHRMVSAGRRYSLIKKKLLYTTTLVVGIVVFMGVSIAAGFAAAATFARVNGTDVSKLRQAGVVGGLIPTVIFCALFTVVNFPRSQFANSIIFIISLPIAAFGTSISLTLAVNKYLIGQTPNYLITAAAAAGTPLLWDLGPVIYVSINYYGSERHIMGQLTLLFLGIGWDSLAGYTFARVSQNLGHSLCKPGAATAAAAVYGVVALIAKQTLFIMVVILKRRRRQKEPVQVPPPLPYTPSPAPIYPVNTWDLGTRDFGLGWTQNPLPIASAILDASSGKKKAAEIGT